MDKFVIKTNTLTANCNALCNTLNDNAQVDEP